MEVGRVAMRGGMRITYHPEFEERSAAAFAHVSWPEYLKMDMAERVSTIAFYRVSQALAGAIEQRRQSRRGKG